MPNVVYIFMLEPHAQTLIKELRFKDLLFIQRISELKSLSSAAIEFRLTQPAASRWLRDLEQAFRGHLFTRNRMVGMTPTPMGELVVQRARVMLADVGSLSSDIEAHQTGRGGHLRLGVIPYVSSRLLERLVSRLVGEYQMTVSVMEAATGPLLEALRLQRLHAVVGRCSMEPIPAELRQEVLLTQKACWLVNAKAPAVTASKKLASLSHLRWVVPPTDSPSWQAIVAACAAAKTAPPKPVVETASTKLVHALVCRHIDMAGVLPWDIGVDLEKLGGVRVMPFPAALKMPAVGLMAHVRHWDFSRIAVLRTALRELTAKSDGSY